MFSVEPADLEFTETEAEAVFAWYEFENRWLPFLRLTVDKAVAEQMRQAAITKLAKDDKMENKWRDQTEQVLTKKGTPTGSSSDGTDETASKKKPKLPGGSSRLSMKRKSKSGDGSGDASQRESDCPSDGGGLEAGSASEAKSVNPDEVRFNQSIID